MAKYAVKVELSKLKTVIVEAGSYDEAEENAKTAFENEYGVGEFYVTIHSVDKKKGK